MTTKPTFPIPDDRLRDLIQRCVAEKPAESRFSKYILANATPSDLVLIVSPNNGNEFAVKLVERGYAAFSDLVAVLCEREAAARVFGVDADALPRFVNAMCVVYYDCDLFHAMTFGDPTRVN